MCMPHSDCCNCMLGMKRWSIWAALGKKKREESKSPWKRERKIEGRKKESVVSVDSWQSHLSSIKARDFQLWRQLLMQELLTRQRIGDLSQALYRLKSTSIPPPPLINTIKTIHSLSHSLPLSPSLSVLLSSKSLCSSILPHYHLVVFPLSLSLSFSISLSLRISIHRQLLTLPLSPPFNITSSLSPSLRLSLFSLHHPPTTSPSPHPPAFASAEAHHLKSVCQVWKHWLSTPWMQAAIVCNPSLLTLRLIMLVSFFFFFCPSCWENGFGVCFWLLFRVFYFWEMILFFYLFEVFDFILGLSEKKKMSAER